MRNNLSYLKDKIITNYIYKKNGFIVTSQTSKTLSTINQITVSYDSILKKLKTKDKIRVAFYVFEKAKWKTDSLYKLMKADDRFEPFVILGFTMGKDVSYSKETKKEKFNFLLEFFKRKGIECKLGYDIECNKHIPLKQYNPDIVFFQQHVWNAKINDIDEVSKYALCCYVPYNVPNYGNAKYDYSEWCTKLFRFYCLNDNLKEHYKKINKFSNNIKVTGHPALDLFYINKDKITDKKYIIYAPHFSIQHPLSKCHFYYSTFTYNSKLILEYAKKHPEYTWVFKPHPILKDTIANMNVPKDCIEDYYNEWEKIGIVSLDSDYYEYFANSKAMLTDCGSFLTEYFCTDKPLIHMVNPNSINWPCKEMEPMFNCFYETHDNRELIETLDRIIVKDDDYKAEMRKETLQNLKFANQNASKNIMNDLRSVLF